MTRRTLTLAAVAAALAGAVMAQPQASGVPRTSPGAEPAGQEQAGGQDPRHPESVEFALNPQWAAVTGLAVDWRGNLVVVGRSGSDKFPTTPDAVDGSCRAGNAALQVLDRAGAPLYSTCFGSDREVAYESPAVAVARDGSLWVVAETRPLARAGYDASTWRISPGQPIRDEWFVPAPTHSCLLAAGQGASVWMACTGYNPGLVTANAWQPSYGGAGDVVVARFEPGRREAALLSYLGGPRIEVPRGLAVAPDGDLVVVGWTYGEGFPLVRPLQPEAGDLLNFFVARMDVSGRWLEFSSRFEVSEYAPVARVAVDRSGNTLVLAMATASCPPPAAAFDRRNPLQDVYLLALDRAGTLQQLAMIEPGFQTRVAPDESMYLHYASVRADGSLLVARTYSHNDSVRSRQYDGGAIVSFLDPFGRPIREVLLVELESGGGWVVDGVTSGRQDLYVVGRSLDARGTSLVVKRVGLGAERDNMSPAAAVGKR